MNNIKKIALNKKISKIDEDYTHVVNDMNLEEYTNGITNLIQTTIYFNNDKQVAKIEKINNLVEFYYDSNNIVTKIQLVANIVINILKEPNEFKNKPFENVNSYFKYKSEYNDNTDIDHGIFFDDRYNIIGRFKNEKSNTLNIDSISIDYMDISGEKINNYQEVIVTPELNDGWNLIGQLNYDNAKMPSSLGTLFFTFEDSGYEQLISDDNQYINLPKGKGVWVKKST